MLLITSLWELSATNVLWAKDLIGVKIEKQSEILFGKNKLISKKETFHKDTQKRLPTLSTSALKDSRLKGWE